MASGLEAIFAQGAAALEANDLPGAEQLFRGIVESEPRAHPAWNALSVVAVRSGFPELALERAKHALELDRRNPVYLNNLGVAYGELGLFAESEQAFRRALKAKPVYPEGHFNLGKVLHKQGRREEALRAYERAYAMDARFPGLLAALVHMHCKTGRAERARVVLEEREGASELAANEYICISADITAELEGAARAISWLRDQLVQRPQLHVLRYPFAQMLLGEGQWREGWHQYLFRVPYLEERIDGSELRPPAPLPDRLDGKSVRLSRDMGLGDSLFFLRFAAELRSRGATLSTMASANLARILPVEVGPIVEDHPLDPRRTWDYSVSICDLPGLLGSTATPPPFALVPEAARAERLRGELARLGPPPYLGLTWRAGTDVLRNREFGNYRGMLSKEVPPAELGAAVRGWPGTLVALQRQPYAGEIDLIAAAAGAPVRDLSALNEDLPDMLAVLALLDEYAAVSNTNVHMIAGLGRTARVLVPYPAEWRWVREGASPWFPGFTIYREPQSRGWAEPLSRLRKDLIG
jgi:Tfp pilus assembly protein PilF